MSELKPCPFCGSKPEQYDNEYACCTGSKCPMANMVIDNRVWNTRAVLAQEAVGQQVMGRVYTDNGVTHCELNSVGRSLPDHTPLYVGDPSVEREAINRAKV
jgi:hypothetical protein